MDAVDRLSAMCGVAGGRMYNLSGSSVALLLAMCDRPFAAVEATEEAAQKLHRDVMFYRAVFGGSMAPVLLIEAPDGPEEAGRRARTSWELEHASRALVMSLEALGHPLWSPRALERRAVTLNPGLEIERAVLEQSIIELGYARVPLVTEPGQYSLRGFILDIFPSTAGRPVRVEFFGDEIESLRAFEVETQRSREHLEKERVLPAREPDDGTELSAVIQSRAVFVAEDAVEHIEVPDGAVLYSLFAIEGEGTDAGLLSMSGLGVLPGERKDINEFADRLRTLSTSERVVLVSSSRGQAERLKEVLMDRGAVCPMLDAGRIASYEGRLSISVGPLSAGLRLPGLLILTEQEIFGGRPAYRPIKKSKVAGLLSNIDDIEVGDFIVHTDRGVGRFMGLVHQSVEGYEYDMLSLEYAGGDKLYLPLHAIDRVRKYHVEEDAHPKLDSLGSKSWQRTKARVRKKIHDLAYKLLKLYAEREVSKGLSFSTDTEIHREFNSFFPYEETPDQARAAEEIKRDMESPLPMDRLLCGDVGYGKTEVAMRAAFKAVHDGKQVAVLAPTTLLCEQHVRIFKKRFAAFPVSVEGLSRFRSAAERTEILKGLKRGTVDIVIATHALLRKDIEFANLGLMIIDEEHRFGVKQKERLKELKRGVDVLAMSATPIPRTLQMSLSGIRTMSLIETPPEERMAVKVTVSAFDEAVVRHAVEHELARGGQVFFVHNRIHDIEKVKRRLERIVPLARIVVGHGRMTERELEKAMLTFLNGDADILLSTAIIGSGLDIPSANTIIINMADRMGLADLYQLKGRVGRSSVKAFAYFLVPSFEEAMTEEARKRLQAVQEMSYMGAGFRLAMRDLEIRGAGNLLGPEQSGAINAVGLDLYMEMMEKEVASIKGIELEEELRPVVNIRLNAFIPEGYVEDMALRLSIYRSIDTAHTDDDLREVEAEMADRFGRPPEPFLNLLKIKSLSLSAGALRVAEVGVSGQKARFTLAEGSPLAPETVLEVFGSDRVRFLKDGFELTLERSGHAGLREALDALTVSMAESSA